MTSLRSALILILALAPVGTASATTARGASGLTLQVQAHVLGGSDARHIELTAVIHNSSKSDMSLRSRPQWLGRCGLTLKIISPTGEAKNARDDEGDCRNERAGGGFPLQAGNAVVVRKTLERGKYFSTPGTYRFSVVFNEPGSNLLVSDPIEVVIR